MQPQLSKKTKMCKSLDIQIQQSNTYTFWPTGFMRRKYTRKTLRSSIFWGLWMTVRVFTRCWRSATRKKVNLWKLLSWLMKHAVVLHTITHRFQTINTITLSRSYIRTTALILKSFELSSQSLFILFCFLSIFLNAIYIRKFTDFYYLAFLF